MPSANNTPPGVEHSVLTSPRYHDQALPSHKVITLSSFALIEISVSGLELIELYPYTDTSPVLSMAPAVCIPH